MLDRMRRHRDWLKWSLGLVCVAFVLFYIPDFLKGTGADAASTDTIAKVEGHEITAGEFCVGGPQVTPHIVMQQRHQQTPGTTFRHGSLLLFLTRS